MIYSSEIVDCAGLSGLVDTLKDSCYAVSLLGKNAGGLVVNNGVDPLICLTEGRIVIAVALIESNSAAAEVGRIGILTTLTDAVDANAADQVSACLVAAKNGCSLHYAA